MEIPHFAIYEKPEYLEQLRMLIPQANRRVWMQTMTFDPEPPFTSFAESLKDAASRGVYKRFTVDMYHKLLISGAVHYLPQLSAAKRSRTRAIKLNREAALTDLAENNVLVSVTNPPRTLMERVNPVAGRNHIKMALLDDVAFVGDIHHFVSKNQPGFMMGITDPNLVNGLERTYISAQQLRDQSDFKVPGNDNTVMLVDTGRPGKSGIIDRSLESVVEATTSIKITGQYTPDGKVVRALQEAQNRGVDVTLYVADPEAVNRPLSAAYDARSQIMLKRAGITIPTREVPGWFHPNILLVDQGLPGRQTVVGTRLFSDTLAGWGTQEVALYSRSLDLLSRLDDYLNAVHLTSTPRDPNKSIREILFSVARRLK